MHCVQLSEHISQLHPQKRGTKLIDEDGLFSLIKASEHLVKKPTAQPQKPPQHQLKTLSGAAGPSTVVLGSRWASPLSAILCAVDACILSIFWARLTPISSLCACHFSSVSSVLSTFQSLPTYPGPSLDTFLVTPQSSRALSSLPPFIRRPVKQGPGNSRPGPSRQGTGELWVDKYKPQVKEVSKRDSCARAAMASHRVPATATNVAPPRSSPLALLTRYGSTPRHSPLRSQKLSDIVANTVLVNTLKGFLQQWEDIHIRGRDPRPVDKGGQRRHDLTKKAVLLSGPPGIGKTTSATIVAKECGFRVVEVNASDTRNQSDKSVLKGVGSKVSNMVKELSTNTGEAGETRSAPQPRPSDS